MALCVPRALTRRRCPFGIEAGTDSRENLSSIGSALLGDGPGHVTSEVDEEHSPRRGVVPDGRIEDDRLGTILVRPDPHKLASLAVVADGRRNRELVCHVQSVVHGRVVDA